MPALRALAALITMLVVALPSVALGMDEPTQSDAPLMACPSPSPARSPGPAESTPASAPPVADPCVSPAASLVTDMVDEIVVEAGDLWFGSDTITLPAHETVTLTLLNKGFITHNLAVDALDLVVIAPAGRSASLTIEDMEPGIYEFYCSISGHREAGMVGTLVVE